MRLYFYFLHRCLFGPKAKFKEALIMKTFTIQTLLLKIKYFSSHYVIRLWDW